MSISKIGLHDLSMLQLSDSFFPTGMYTMSNGLEALFYSNRKVMNPDGLRELIKVYLEHQIGPADCRALGNSCESAQQKDLRSLLEIDNTISSMKLIEELRNASIRSGIQVLKCVKAFLPNNDILNRYHQAIKSRRASGVYPVALAVVGNACGIPKNKAGLMMVYGFCVSLVGAALRLGILDYVEGQKIIHELKPTMLETVMKNIDRPISGMWQFAPGIDLLQISHERMSSKMFIT
jgi:urease accessory protein